MPVQVPQLKDPKALAAKAARIGALAVRATTAAGSGHPSSSLSLAHIVSVLLYDQMKWDPKNPWNSHADRLVLSEGHSVPIVYAALADLGAAYGKTSEQAKTLTLVDLDTLRDKSSILDGHPNPALGFPFFDAATGSLGQGLSVAAGLGLAARLDKIPKTIYVIIGDGESREGQVWEALDFIAEHRLENIRAVFNCNGQGQTGLVSGQQSPENLAKKIASFGWHTVVVDGHDVTALQNAFREKGQAGQSVAIVARTVKGWGVPVLQAKGNHGKPLPAKDLPQALADLAAEEKKAGALPDGLAPEAPVGQPVGSNGHVLLPLPEADFEKLLEGDGFLEAYKSKKKLGTRRAYGLALRELGRKNAEVVALDAEVSNSTFAEFFKFAVPERFFECRIAEQNMVSAAGGLAAAGKIPFASSFGKFLSRAMDQIELCVISGHNLKIVGSHSGISIGPDGPSQMSVTDIAFFRSFPGNTSKAGRQAVAVLNPADAVCAYKLVEWMARRHGLVYMRTMRADLPLLYPKDEKFEVPGAKLLKEGKDLLIAATGYMVHTALELLPKLEAKGIKAGLLDCYTFPAPEALVVEQARRHSSRILTLEDNYRGLASEIAEICAGQGNIKVRPLSVEMIAKSAKEPQEVFDYVGLSLDAMVQAAQELVR